MVFVGEIMEEKDVELEDVTKKFGDFVAVDDISFSVKKGEFFSLSTTRDLNKECNYCL